ncbi:hypothetical protein AGR8A_pTi10032 [Agrobacterium fabrum str. J-07]|nr:hypothetical protein AGR8A_pTi10032 [Agrobacterium fabrum str. J-07]
MARRALLSEAWWQQATIIPDDEREIAKHYTLDRSDLDLIMRQNKASNRLGLACVLATLRYPGRPLADGEVLPAGVLRFLARQIGVDHHGQDRCGCDGTGKSPALGSGQGRSVYDLRACCLGAFYQRHGSQGRRPSR